MVLIGKKNVLRIVKKVEFGIYLDGGSLGEILMPARYVPEGIRPDDELEVFIYLDSEDRLIATTEEPYAMVGDFAFLRVVGMTSVGAFLDWGLPKDLLVPFREQRKKPEVGKNCFVYVYLDSETNRIVATAKPEKLLDRYPSPYQEGQEVDLVIFEETDLGYKAMINTTHTGILYRNEIFQNLEPGQKIKGYIRKIRPDGKTDLILHKPGYEKISDLSAGVIQKLNEQGGFIGLSDKSSAQDIYAVFGFSKKTFKKIIGGLYKNKQITIEDEGIRITE